MNQPYFAETIEYPERDEKPMGETDLHIERTMPQDTDPFVDPDVISAIEATQSYRRRQALERTPKQRLDLSRRLRDAAMKSLCTHPAGYDAFVRRNHHRRRETNRRKLEADCLRARDAAS